MLDEDQPLRLEQEEDPPEEAPLSEAPAEEPEPERAGSESPEPEPTEYKSAAQIAFEERWRHRDFSELPAEELAQAQSDLRAAKSTMKRELDRASAVREFMDKAGNPITTLKQATDLDRRLTRVLLADGVPLDQIPHLSADEVIAALKAILPTKPTAEARRLTAAMKNLDASPGSDSAISAAISAQREAARVKRPAPVADGGREAAFKRLAANSDDDKAIMAAMRANRAEPAQRQRAPVTPAARLAGAMKRLEERPGNHETIAAAFRAKRIAARARQ